MQTNFSAQQLENPDTASAAAEIRKCVHCGFCTATCPTYVLLGDELDSPRGRISLMKDMLEHERIPTPKMVKHIDRCLSCLSCMTTCPSDVTYSHLVDHARGYIEQHYKRPIFDRLLRSMLANILPWPIRFRAALWLGRFARPLAPIFAQVRALRLLVGILNLVPKKAVHSRPVDSPKIASQTRGRVIVLQGCVEPILRPDIRAATLRVLARAGYEAILVRGENCCGSLVHHLGRAADSHKMARSNIDAWTAELSKGVDAILVTASGCGAMIKDYGYMLRNEPKYAERAAHLSSLAQDISEFLDKTYMPLSAPEPLTIAYHAACALQHWQKITQAPINLLRKCGFDVRTPRDAHLCCGSAGTYNILQPDISRQLRARKLDTLNALGADVIVTGNIGCATQLETELLPVVHLVEILDWASGGPKPARLERSA
jgi:glycolate oxidase iron-sulfur subunit